MMESVEYDTVRLTARPPRALVAYEPGSSWTAAATDTFRWLSSCWGGAAGAVLPLLPDGPLPTSRLLLETVRSLDPDAVVYRPASVSDMDHETVRRTFRRFDGGALAETVGRVRRDDSDVPVVSRGDLWPAGVLRWCAARHPYEEELDLEGANTGFHPVQYAAGVTEPFTSTVVATGPAVRATSLVLDDLDPVFALMVASRAGVSPEGRSASEIVPGDGDLKGLAEWAMTGSTREGRLPCVDSRAAASYAGRVPSDTLLEALPLPTTRIGTAWLHPPLFQRAPFVLVVGDGPSDHAFAVLADRMLHVGAWAPAGLLANTGPTGDAVRFAVGTFLHTSLMGNAARCPTVVTSTTLEEAEVREALGDAGGIPDSVDFVAAEQISFEHRKFLADPEAADRPSTHPVAEQDGTITMLTAAEPLVPSVFLPRTEGSWMVDVRPGRAVLGPARAAIPSTMLLGEDSRQAAVSETLVRTSTRGLAFWSQAQTMVLAGALRGSTYARPLLRFPGAADTVVALAKAAGMSTRLSVVGRRAQSVADMWGGSGALATDLGGPVRALLRALATRGRNGPRDWGCVVNNRGHVHFKGARGLLNADEPSARETLDRLVVRGAVRRGLLLGCERCSNVDFYRTAEFADTFRCKRCAAANLLVGDRWRHPRSEPIWFYDLDPLVEGFFEQNGDIPLVAADTVLRRHGQPGSATYEIEFVRDEEVDPWIELDFACTVDGRLYLGEAKSNGNICSHDRSLTDTAQRVATLVVALTVDHVILATSAAEWKLGQVDAVREAISQQASRVGSPIPTVEALTVEFPDLPISLDLST